MRLDAPIAGRATLSMPGDKSVSHRALFLAALANGTSLIAGANAGDDVAATARALHAAGVRIDRVAPDAYVIDGSEALRDPPSELDCANSGTTMRLFAGFAAARIDATLVGDQSLMRRPMERVAEPLRMLGADVRTTQGRPPVTLRRGTGALRGRRIELEVASAQVKSAILIAGLRAAGETCVIEPAATRDHTERLLAVMGADIAVAPHEIRVRPGALRPIERFAVPGDFSAAFFFLAAGATLPGCDVALTGVGVNPTRTAALAVLRRMGASIDSAREREVHGEPVADIIVRGGAGLTPFEIGHDVVPALIDEIPALCVVAASAHGTSSVRGAAELRGKESDRIATTAALLRAFGVRVDEHPDGIDVHGPARLGAPAAIDTHGDHRIGMSAAVLACAARAPIVIDGARCIATSFPGFDAAWRKAFGG